MTLALAIPDAEAARRKKRLVKAYSPPYASMVYDVNSGRVLQETHGNALRHPASVTKVMTLYMLFEQMERGRFKLDSELPVSAHAARQPPSKLGLKPGETISVEDAIKALVTKSANDVAAVVAEAVGGSEERFAELMTARARSIGMSRTLFRNASGLPDPEQVTTARDLVILGRVIQDRFPRYYTYFGTRVFEYNGWAMRNHNRLLGRVEGVDGIKTGYTRASGFNLLTSAKTEGRHIITVVLGGRSGAARDAQVAALVENHMPRALAGRRTTPRTIDVAGLDDDDDDKPAPRAAVAARPSIATPPQVAAVEVPRAVSLPAPPSRPRPAVIAETGERSSAEAGLTRTRQLALSASGSTGIVSAATTPMALVSTTPRSPALRWVPGPSAAEPAQRTDYAQRQETREPQSREPRPVPPANVRYTNALAAAPAAAEPEQPLPAPAAPVAKIEQRLASPAVPTPAPSPAALPRASETPAARPAPVAARPELPAAKPEPLPVRSAPAALQAGNRSGWVIQLAAADSEGKARSILDGAREKAGRLLASAEPFTEPVAKGSSTLFRARFAGFDADEAQNACKALKRNGFNCFAQKI